MPLEQKADNKAKNTKVTTDDADDAAAVLAKMQAKEDDGDCAFC